MAYDIFFAVASVLCVGALSALITLLVAKKSVFWALILGPLTVVLSIAVGLICGLKLMLIEGEELVVLILAITAPIALLIGIFVSTRMQKIVVAQDAKLQEAKRQSELDQAKRELIGAISHDLKTPLAGIRAMAEALEDGIAPDPMSYYKQIAAQAKRTATMVEEMMSLARLSSGKQSLVQETLSLNDIMSDVVAAQQALAHAKDISIRFAADVEDLSCTGDAQLISRALQNIVSNAIAYSHVGSTIQVLMQKRKQMAYLGVHDACGGISREVETHMFEVGWRSQTARTPDGSHGSGLGLAIVKSIAEAHGGRAFVEPREDACIVWIALPLNERRHT